MVRFSVSPVFQALTVAVTRQAPGPPGEGEGEGEGDGDGDGLGDGEGEGDGDGLGEGDGEVVPSRPRKVMALPYRPSSGRPWPAPAKLHPSTGGCTPEPP
ncbi:hypothetical protein ACFFWE_11860 [Sphaerisporangium melleum]